MNAVFKGGMLTETPQKSGISRLFSKVILKGTQRGPRDRSPTRSRNLAAASAASRATTASAFPPVS